MMPGRYSMEVKMDRTGSSALRDFLKDHDFEIYRQTPVRRLEKVEGDQYSVKEEMDGTTFLAVWNGDHRHSYHFEILDYLETCCCVIEAKASYIRDLNRYSDEVPG